MGLLQEKVRVMFYDTTSDGLPISYEVFPGNTHEVQTLLPSIEKSRERFDVDGKIAAKLIDCPFLWGHLQAPVRRTLSTRRS